MLRAAANKLSCAVAICIVLFLAILGVPCSPHQTENRMMMLVVDRPITTYPEYRELMLNGEVYITRDGITEHIIKNEKNWHWLQRLGILVRAE